MQQKLILLLYIHIYKGVFIIFQESYFYAEDKTLI